MGSCCSISSKVIETGLDYEFLFYKDTKCYSFEYTKIDLRKNSFQIYTVYVKYYLDERCEVQIKGRHCHVEKLLEEAYYILSHDNIMVNYKEMKNVMLTELEKRMRNK